MKKIFVLIIATALCAAALLPALVQSRGKTQEQSNGPQAETQEAIHHDVSPPLRDIQSAPRASLHKEEKRLLIPHAAAAHQQDPVLQGIVNPQVATTAGLNFAGVGNGDYGFVPNAAPPDTNASVGATQVVQWVNESFAVFDKATGTIVPGFPKAGNTVWAGFGGGCETNNDGDPIVQYDKANNRWILTQFSVTTTPYLQCVAVSTTKACAYDSAAMRSGAPTATQVCFQLSSSFGGLLPSDLDGSTAPPAGSPNFFLNFGTNSLNLWKFHVDFATPANSTFTGPTNIPVAAFNVPCSGGGACIPQPATTQKLDSLGDRLMYRLAYRNRAGVESLVVNHSVAVGANKRNKVTSVRWYELRNPNGATTVFQQGTLSTVDGIHRWMGSIAMDKVGDIAVGYSASSGSILPSIRYTGRVPTDPLGQMQTENIIQNGGGSQTGGLNRWGDYSSISLDPVDDCTYWYTTEYLKSSGSFNWSTRIASFKFPGCL